MKKKKKVSMSNSPYMRTQKNKFLENFKKIIKDFYLPIFRKIYIYIYIECTLVKWAYGIRVIKGRKKYDI